MWGWIKAPLTLMAVVAILAIPYGLMVGLAQR